MPATPTCVYRVDPELVEALDARLGPPLDSYVRGWQVWLEPNGPDGAVLEWRLHPPAGFSMPRGVNPHDLFELVLQGLAAVGDPSRDAFQLGRSRLALCQVWEVLEVFPAFIDQLSPAAVAQTAQQVLGRPPAAAGAVDHDRLGDLYRARRGELSVGQALLTELSG